MKRRSKRKLNFVIIIIVIISFTIGYAVMNRELTITGNSEVKSNSWDIHFENVVVKEGSVTATKVPTIDTEKDGIDFSVSLNLPGDYYSFTVDVVNNGSMDGMVATITKTPELTDAQKKYLNYKIEYENGEAITSKQLVKKESFVRVKVIVEYRKDITETDLPTVDNTLNLGFTINYVQSDGTGSEVYNNGLLIKYVTGDGTNTSDEICFNKECFYVMYSDDTTVTMLSKYNLYVGNTYDGINTVPLENPTGRQYVDAIGRFDGNASVSNPYIATVAFSSTNYWKDTVSTYSAYVYNSNSLIYSYVENYKDYLTSLGLNVNEARLISHEELLDLGCGNYYCGNSVEWVRLTTFWTGTAYDVDKVWRFSVAGSSLDGNPYDDDYRRGVRPVIVISKDILS